MREFKFRVWDNGKKCFIPADTWAICTNGSGATGVMIKDWENYDFGQFLYAHAQELTQFTGHFDKTAKPIYENDIMQDDCFTGAVTYNDSLAAFTWHGGEKWDRIEEVTVIGNVYENMELLKETS